MNKNNQGNKKYLASSFLTDYKSKRFFSKQVNTRMSLYAQGNNSPAHWTDESCTPGETKMNDCNECSCLRDGSGYSCTRKVCVDDTIKPTDVPAVKVCVPGHVTMKKCNKCRCNRYGSDYLCTRMACRVGEFIGTLE